MLSFFFRKTEKVIWLDEYGGGKWKITWWIFYIIPIRSYIVVI